MYVGIYIYTSVEKIMNFPATDAHPNNQGLKYKKDKTDSNP